ncbi:hypothetical protein BDN67DRAFT_962465 [Paxillus ammoniavirescens]|nr:hypothetical protein BDN67DRAFT_962465 [Paxillus ammoniavirescens]
MACEQKVFGRLILLTLLGKFLSLLPRKTFTVVIIGSYFFPGACRCSNKKAGDFDNKRDGVDGIDER